MNDTPNLIDATREEYRDTSSSQLVLDLQEEDRYQDDQCRDREPDDQNLGSSNALVSNGPLRKVNISKVHSLWQMMEQLTNTFQLNKYELPEFIYRPDLISWEDLVGYIQSSTETTTTMSSPAEGAASGIQEAHSMLDAALVPLSYAEGFPVLPSGRPFWQQLEFESGDAYFMFQQYLELPGARQLSDLDSFDLSELRELYHTNYWTYRAKAFDLYRAVHHQKVKIQRMLDAEDTHYGMAEKFLRTIENYLSGVSLDDDNITPEKAINIMEKLVKIQRVSAGLPANGESKENSAPRGMSSVLGILQQVTQSQKVADSDEENTMDMLSGDPEAVEYAQKLIIAMQTNGGGGN